MKGARMLKVSFFRSRATWQELAQSWGCSGLKKTLSTNPCNYFPKKVNSRKCQIFNGALGFEQSESQI